MSIFQTCEVEKKKASILIADIDDQTISKSLYNANGKCGEVSVSATKNIVTKCLFMTSGEPVSTSFSVRDRDMKKPIVVDMDALCLENDRYGIAVAINDTAAEDAPEEDQNDDGFRTKKSKEAEEKRSYNSVVLYVENHLRLFVKCRLIRVFGEITCMRVLLSPLDMPSQHTFLSPRIATWHNVVAIGCKKSACYLGQFAAIDVDNKEEFEGPILNVTATTDALKSMTDSRGRVTYQMSGEGGSHIFTRDSASVTAVSYIPCYALVVVGLSNGGIVLVPLDGKSSITCLTVPYATPITHLVVLEPEYDPQGGFFLFSARAKVSEKNVLGIFSHKISRTAAADGEGYEYSDMNTVIIPLKDGAHWINVHGVVEKRKRKDGETGNDSTSANESLMPEGLNTSQHINHDGMDRTLLFYSYRTIKGDIKGGLFDLNAFYSRRCGVQQVRFDEHGQHPVCSQFTLTLPVADTGIALFRAKHVSFIHCRSVSRYECPIFDREQLFQPMAAELSLAVHTFGNYAYPAKVNSLQLETAHLISGSLFASLTKPDVALALLESVGMLLAPTTRRERMKMEERPKNEQVPGDLDKIMRAVVSEPACRANIIRYVDECENRLHLLHIGRWLFNELREIVTRMDEAITPLFDSSSFSSLPKSAKDIIDYCPEFFEFAESVFWKIRKRGAHLANDTTKLRYIRKLYAKMAYDLRLFLAAALWFTRTLPSGMEWTRELTEDMVELLEERRDKARQTGRTLYLDALLGRLHEKTMDDPLWRDMDDPREWFPPALFNLVSMVRQNEAELDDRIALVCYFLLDVDECLARNAKRPAEQRRAYPLNASLLNSFFDVRGDRGEPGQLVARESAEGVRERWKEDMTPPKADNENAAHKVGLPSTCTKQDTENFIKLMKAYKTNCKLQKEDEEILKAIMDKQGYGSYRWNVLLIKKGRFREVLDLPVPCNPTGPFPHPVVKEYAKYKALSLAQKRELPPPTNIHAFACPYRIIEPAEPESAPHAHPHIVRSGVMDIKVPTPKKIFVSKFAAAGAALPSTPNARDTARVNAMLKTPSMKFCNRQGASVSDDESGDEGGENASDVAPDEIARVRDALRTPRSRATASARRGGAAAAGESTPENAPRPPTVPPTSILKSAHKVSRLPSAMKSGIRFANVIEEQKTISPRDKDTTGGSSLLRSPDQPNFDDSFEDGSELSKSVASSSNAHSSTRLERELEEEELNNSRAESTEEASRDLIELPSGDEQDATTNEIEEEEEEMEMEGVSDEAPAMAANATFEIYHDSPVVAASSIAADVIAHVVDEANVSRAVTPVDGEEEEERPVIVVREEEEEEEAAEAATHSPLNETYTVERSEEREQEMSAITPIVGETTGAEGDVVEGGEEEEEGEKEEEKAEEEPNLSRAVTPTEEDEEEEEDPAVVASSLANEAAAAADVIIAAAAGGGDAAAAAAAMEKDVSRAVTPVEGEEEEQEQGGEEEEEDVVEERELPAAPHATPTEPGVSRADTPSGEGEEVEEQAATPIAPEEEEEEEQIPAIVAPKHDDLSRAVTPVGDDAVEDAVVQPAQPTTDVVLNAVEAALHVVGPPVPKPRTIFGSRAEAMAAGLRSYTFMEGGIEKSYEEQRTSDEEEEEEEEEDGGDVLARLSPPPAAAATRRSSSRLQQRTPSAAAAAASGSRKRTASRTRRASENEDTGPSTPLRSPRGKKERKEDEEEEKEQEAEAEGHLYTTTRTSIVEERYVERGDGVLQHTVKQSTKVIETADGVVVKDEQEDKETVEEEGDKELEEAKDESDGGRATPAALDAAAPPSTARKSSRAPASRSRTTSTASIARSKKDEEEEKTKKREEKATTPLRSTAQQTRRGKLMSEEREKEEEKQEEPLTPRRSSRTRRASEASSSSAAAAAATTPSKRKSAARAAKTPSREPSAAPVSPPRLLVLGEEEEDKAPVPAKRSRTRKDSSKEEKEEKSKEPARRGLRASSITQAVERMAREKEEELKEVKEDNLTKLRRARDAAKANAEERRAYDAKRKAAKLSTIPEGVETKASKKAAEDEPGASKASAITPRRKRTQSETVAVLKASIDKTPSTKKAKDQQEEDEEAADASMLRRSSRKAAAAANEGLKTPSKSAKGKQ